MASDKPLYVQLRKGRWFWEPPARLRKSHKLTTKALGTDQSAAWAMARRLTEEAFNAPAGAAAPGTVAWVFDQFFLTKKFQSLAHSTKVDYRWLAKRLSKTPVGSKTLGQINARSIRPRHADLIYASIHEESGHSLAHYCARFARRVWKWAGRAEHVDMINPWSGMNLEGLKQREQLWTPEQIETAIQQADEMGYPSIGLAVRLAYAFAHRKVDILSLTWGMLDAQLRETSKTRVKLPMVLESYPDLEVAVAAERARQAKAGGVCEFVVQCELTGGKWHTDTFTHYFRDVMNAARLPADLQFRDLRATAVTEIADADTDPVARSTHSGHKTLSEDRHYSRRTVTQFKRAAAKRNAHKNKDKTIDGTGDGTTEPEKIVGKKA